MAGKRVVKSLVGVLGSRACHAMLYWLCYEYSLIIAGQRDELRGSGAVVAIDDERGPEGGPATRKL